jgi:hypothetical protein
MKKLKLDAQREKPYDQVDECKLRLQVQKFQKI